MWARTHVKQGEAVGHAVAAGVLRWRQNDGWPATQAAVVTPDPTYVLPTFPGLWQPTPPANSFATFTFYRNVGNQGLQFSSVGGWVYEQAKKNKMGREIPTEWFLQDIRD